MPAPDSLRSLIDAIVSTIRTDSGSSGGDPTVDAEIDALLWQEAVAGERRLSYVRAVVACGAIAVNGWTPRAAAASVRVIDVAPVVIASAWGLLSVALIVALRRGWHGDRVRYIAPAVDALAIWLLTVIPWSTDGASAFSTERIAYLLTLSGFLVVSGAARVSSGSAKISAALGVAVFAFLAGAAGIAPLVAASVGAALLALGLLAVQQSTLVRRVVSHEVHGQVMKRLYNDARKASEAREEVLKIVSHDLRNPLNTVSMAVGLLLEVQLPDQERVRHLTTVQRAGERMNRMIQDLLDVAKLESGRLAIVPQSIPASALLAEADAMLRPLAVDRAIELEVHVDPQIPDLHVDSGRVLQVISNLVGNALKFTGANGKVSIRGVHQDGEVKVSVADTGPGIPPDQQAKVFARMWQADPTDRRGIGLGLAIAKGIVEAHGGRIWFDTVVGSGTTFHFTLPTQSGGVSVSAPAGAFRQGLGRSLTSA